MQYDVFVSYGWGRYTPLSSELATELKTRGYSVWLDREQVIDRLSDAELTAKIKNGLSDSRYIAFFEAEARMAAQVGGDPIHVPRWQEKELQWSDKQRLMVLYHSMKPSRLIFGQSSVLHEYNSIQAAAQLIHDAIKDPDKYFKPGSGGSAAANAEADVAPQVYYAPPPPPPKYMRA